MGPGSAPHAFVLRRARDKHAAPARLVLRRACPYWGSAAARTKFGFVRRPASPQRPCPPVETMRFILRFIGLWLLAGAFVALIIDGTASIAGGSIRFNTFGQTWDNIYQESKPAAKAFVVRHAGDWVWTSGIQVVLDQPT